ncbi:SRPBCC family protein [Nocardioides terrisoli]|uniref:SRPBCC family protein n=1 Tax=Nocardioides terrisoli TaxID=3388267 RepID=UPI00287BB641|nr:SRPBCC family protein [Nocardioides marmorisolisilvae]
MSDTPIPISATTEMAAGPDRVWDVVSDLRRMPRFSPELRAVVLLGHRNGLGQLLLGINRRGPVAWPTTSRVVRWEPGRAIAWRTRESGATWVYEIEPVDVDGRPGSRVTARRELPAYTVASRLMTPLLGGAAGHDRELAHGLAATLARMKQVVEA